MTTKTPLLAGLAVLLLCSAAATATPLPSPVPSGLLPTTAANLKQIHDRLIGTHDRIDGEIDKQNSDCSDVRSDDQARVADCEASQQRILSELSEYKSALAQYERAVKHLPLSGVGGTMARIGASTDVRDTYMMSADGKRYLFHAGDPLILNAHVITGSNGHVQFLLLDETVVTLGPNSDMVMDKYVYDPDTHEGTIAARLRKGVFRFVSGHMASREPELRVPSGALGHRGTEYEVSLANDGSVRLKDFQGAIYFVPKSGGPEVSLKAGEMVEIDAKGRAGMPIPLK